MVNIIREVNDKEFEKTATRVSVVGIIGNFVLVIFKAIAGLLGHSSAMISDAIHSASDVVSSIIVIVGVKISRKEADEEHPYGHERYESVAAIILAIILLFTGLMIGSEAVEVISNRASNPLRAPGRIALVAAIISIICKEIMYRYTIHHANRIGSESLKASAWDHRSDALSSVGALLGIGGAIAGYPILDPIASIIICVFIMRAAYGIFKGAVDQMIDKAAPDEVYEELRACIESQEGVIAIDKLRTRVFGNKIYVDVDIAADGSLTLHEGHEIAERVHDAIEKQFASVKHIMVHVNPFEEDNK